MNIFTKILFVILAVIILVLGFFVGTIILIVIFTLLILMTILFVVIWIFNNIVSLFQTNFAKLAFKSIFSVAITYGLIELLWLFTSKSFLAMDKAIAISTLWVISALIFGTLWYLLHLKQSAKKHQYLWDEYKSPNTLSLMDVLLMVVFPSIMILIFNSIHTLI
ncbi:MAG: hypothetical protein WCX82_00060 [archaeon]|jgi:hypothetical protein